MKLFDLLKDHVGMSQEEAEKYFTITDAETEYVLKPFRFLEMATFKALVGLAQEYGGSYDSSPNARCFHIPKEGMMAITEFQRAGKTTDGPSKLDEALGRVPPVEASAPSTEEYALNRSLKGKLGQLVPCLEDAEGIIFDGFHRKNVDPKAWTVKLDKIKTPVDRALARMTVNFCRRHYTSEEMKNDIGLLAGSGYSVQDIQDITGIGSTTIYKYYPQQLKDEKRSEAGKLGGDAKAESFATQVKQTVKTQDGIVQTPTFKKVQEETLKEIVECAYCHMGFHVSKATLIDDQNVCPRCVERVKPKPKPPVTETKEVKPRDVDTWEHRKAQMSPQHSKIEELVGLKLQEAEIKPVSTDRAFCLQSATPDFYLTSYNLAIYLDGPVHEGKEDRDEKLRELLAERHGLRILSIPYKNCSESEVAQIMEKIKKALGKEA